MRASLRTALLLSFISTAVDPENRAIGEGINSAQDERQRAMSRQGFSAAAREMMVTQRVIEPQVVFESNGPALNGGERVQMFVPGRGVGLL